MKSYFFLAGVLITGLVLIANVNAGEAGVNRIIGEEKDNLFNDNPYMIKLKNNKIEKNSKSNTTKISKKKSNG